MPDNQENVSHSALDSAKQQDIARLIKRLGSRNSRKRDEAERLLRDMGATALEPLLAAVGREARPRGSWKVLFLVLIALIVLREVWKGLHGGLGFSDLEPAFWICSLYYLAVLIPPGASVRHRNLVHLLAAIDDQRAVGPYAEALGFAGFKDPEDWDAREAARTSLVHLLPLLHAGDSHLLHARQRDLLRRAVLGNDKPLTIAILKAWEQIGDVRDLAFVEKICSRDREIMEAAKACLLCLMTRTAQQQVSQTLLRASEKASTTSDMLLRPVSGQIRTEGQETLLRASSDGVKKIG